MTPEQLKKVLAELRKRNGAIGEGFELRAVGGDGASLPTEFLLIPIGKKVFHVESGYGENFTAQHAAEMVANFARFNSKPFFDLDHDSLWGSTAAYAWITSIEARADGVWVTGIDWLAAGKELLEEGTYRYFSPAWYWNDSNPYSPEGEEVGARLISVALTNTPQYYNAENLSKRNKEIRAMDFMAKLKAALGLPAEATDEQILEAITALKTKASATTDETAANANKAILDAVRSELGLKADAGQEAIEAALAARKPVPGNQTVEQELAAIKAERATEKAERAVDAAIAARKIIPAQREKSIRWAAKDPEGFADWVKDQPELVPGGPIVPRKVGSDGKPEVTDADRALAKRTGQKPEDIAATRHALELEQG